MDGKESLKIAAVGAFVPGMMAHTLAQRYVFRRILTELEREERDTHHINLKDKIRYYTVGIATGVVEVGAYVLTGYDVMNKIQMGEYSAAAGSFLVHGIARGIATGAMHRSSSALSSLITRKVWRWD